MREISPVEEKYTPAEAPNSYRFESPATGRFLIAPNPSPCAKKQKKSEKSGAIGCY